MARAVELEAESERCIAKFWGFAIYSTAATYNTSTPEGAK
jgi:hypothetical protein